ncbi:MAG: phosphonoacetaldehyde reductase [Lachnospiraceae bacterium]|nr:phosphonoacetaldehyde reductase [Lachnospiraceae bacterium]
MEQTILTASKNYPELDRYLQQHHFKTVLVVCDSSLPLLEINQYFDEAGPRLSIQFIKFHHISPNPQYESVVEGVAVFHQNHCDSIIAVGGGSAMDVAKCIKLYSHMDPELNYLQQEIIPNTIELLAVPTTAGTGSEATRYAVIYLNGEKQSITDESCIPNTVLFDASALKTLPEYQRKSTMMDALCHGIESFWSVNSTEESQAFSKKAIRLILENKDSYLRNESSGNEAMLHAAYIAGKAINITQTTAGHAMCYKMTSLYGISHGHGAALCVAELWPYMVQNSSNCIDIRGEGYLNHIFNQIAASMGCASIEEGIQFFRRLLVTMKLDAPIPKHSDYSLLSQSVNPIRLKNNPVRLERKDIDNLYHKILRNGEAGNEGRHISRNYWF